MRLHTGCTEKDLLPKIVTMIERICVDAPEKTFLTPDQQSEETHLCTTTNRERRCNYCFTMCKKKKLLHNAQQSHSFHHNLKRSPQSTPIFNYHQYCCYHILPSKQIFPQLYVSNRHSVHGTLYTSKVDSFLEKIPRKDLWVCVSTEMCSHYWVTPPFDFITAHCITPYICPYYSSHNIHSIFVFLIVFVQYKLYLYEHWYLIS